MIVVKLKGGLGNQMFQYALGRSLSLRNKSSLFLDRSGLENNSQHTHTQRKYELDHFNIKANIGNGGFLTYNSVSAAILYPLINFFSKNKRLRFVPEKINNFDPDILRKQDNSYFDGYWNTPKYFNEYADIIKKDFTFKVGLTSEERKQADKIKSCCSVSIHIRRGDYISNKDANAYHGTCSDQYYSDAIQIILEKNKEAVFFIFSDDPDWVHKHFKIDAKHFIVSNTDQLNGLTDMHLMSLCKHAITANSTFSWWAAWLIENKDKTVIAPIKWFQDSSVNMNDLFPNSWLRI
ncbi:MAG: alpha-1,2-fucosyltransferase [Bacteroidota bacterium]